MRKRLKLSERKCILGVYFLNISGLYLLNSCGCASLRYMMNKAGE